MMAKNCSILSWFQSTSLNESNEHTFGQQEEPSNDVHPHDHSEQDENNSAVHATSVRSPTSSSASPIEMHDRDHLVLSPAPQIDVESATSETDIKSNGPVQVSSVCVNPTALIKIMAVIIIALVLAGLLSIPFILFTAAIKNIKPLKNFNFPESDNGVMIQNVSMCQNTLLETQSCFRDGERISEMESSLVEDAEKNVNKYISQLNQLLLLIPVNQQCEVELRALVCAAGYIELCDTSKITTLLQNCERTTTTTCETEFPQIQSILQSVDMSLTCDSLVGQETTENTNIEGTGNGVSDIRQPRINTSRNCSDGFFVDDLGLCKPECGEWWPRTPSELKLLAITHITIASIGAIITLIVIILSCINYKTMFQFPGIFIVYQMLSIFPFIVFILISYTDIKGLLCTHRDLIEVLKPGNGGTFCTIAGAVWIYFTSQIAIWWFFHILMIFFSVFWPFKYQYWRKLGRFKYVHAVMVVIGLILPLIPVFINLAYGYEVIPFYPPICGGYSQNAAFYSHLFPVMIVDALGFYLLILIFTKFFLEECMSKKKKNSGKRQVEIKILLLLLSYVVSLSVFFGVSARVLIKSFDYSSILEEYLTCQAFGRDDCSTEGLEQISVIPGVIMIVIALYPTSFLVYFMNCCIPKQCHNNDCKT